MTNYASMSNADLLAAYQRMKDPFETALQAEGVTGRLADVARSIYQQESGGGKNTRTSNAGAVGGMQIIPSTFASVADKDWSIGDPHQNARAGIRYLKQLSERAGGDPALTAAGYYGGPGGLEKARRGVAVSDPRNPKAPNTLQYGQQVAARLPSAPTEGGSEAGGGASQGSYEGMSDEQLLAAYQKLKGAPNAKPAPSREAPKTSPSHQAGAKANSSLQGLLASINGPLLGFGDEIIGALGAPLKSLVSGQSVAESYREGRDFARGAQETFRDERPWTNGLTQLAASAPLGALKLFAAPAAGQKLGILAQTGQAATTGAGYGAISGAGNSRAQTAGGVAGDAAIGAAAGAALSGAAIPVAQAVRGAGRNVGARFSDKIAARHAQEKVAESLIRDASGTLAQSGAANPVQMAAIRLDRLSSGGGNAVVADSAGQSTRSLLDVLASLPGKTKESAFGLLKDRKQMEAKNLIASAESALGTGGRRLASTVDDLTAAQQQAAAPLYSQLRQTAITPSQTLQEIVKAADDLGAVKLGREMATARQQPFTLNLDPPPVNALGQPATKQWTMNDLDQVKRGLDQKIAKEWDDVAGKLTPRGAAFQDLKRKLVSELDDATLDPQTGTSLYKSARDAFAGPAALIDAARLGQRSITQGEAAITQSMKGMTLSEQEAFRVGAFESLREKIGRSAAGRTELMNMAENPAVAEKLRVIFGSDRAFRRFAADASKAKTLKQLQGTAQGSRTFERQYAAGDMDVSALKDASGVASSAASGNALGALAAGASAWNRVKTPEAVRDRMGQILLSGGQQGKNELQQMLAIIEEVNRARITGAAMTGTGVGVGLGSFANR